jgi:putative transposase
MTGLFWLSQVQFDRIRPCFPLSHGKPRADDSRVISGIIYVLRNGLRWKDAPPEYGPHGTLYHRFRRWSRMGIFNSILAELSDDGITLDWLMIESTPLEAQRTAARLLKAGMFPAVSEGRGRAVSNNQQIDNGHMPKRYTTVGLELELQDALKEIAVMEGCSVRRLCTAVYDLKKPTNSFASALRVFLVEYYRSKSKSLVNNEVSQVLERLEVHLSGS